jgi:hypothetical protein
MFWQYLNKFLKLSSFSNFVLQKFKFSKMNKLQTFLCSFGKRYAILIPIFKQPEIQPVCNIHVDIVDIHVDIVGPLPVATCGSRYLFTVVDRSSRWLEALPMRYIAAASCADAGWISRYGVPAQLTSDRGTQFTSAIWDALCQQLGIQHQPTTAFHPQANGMVERCLRRLKDALRASLAGPDWPLHLPWVLMGLRAAPQRTEESPLPKSSSARRWFCRGRS